MTNAPQFTPGFRISKIDITFIFLALFASTYLFQISAIASFIIIFTTFHFFLFCNVFRIQRKPELIWATIFITLTYGTIIHQIPSWTINIVLTLSLTILLIFFESKKPSYHGVFWQKINPELKSWWSSHQKDSHNSIN